MLDFRLIPKNLTLPLLNGSSSLLDALPNTVFGTLLIHLQILQGIQMPTGLVTWMIVNQPAVGVFMLEIALWRGIVRNKTPSLYPQPKQNTLLLVVVVPNYYG